MFEIEFYKDKNEYSETNEWLAELNKKAVTSKDHRIRLKKFYEYLELLAHYGTFAGEPAMKPLTGTEFWELRPTRDRVIFCSCH